MLRIIQPIANHKFVRDFKALIICSDIRLAPFRLIQKVEEIGRRISEDYQGRNLLMVSVLKGSVVFMADLMRAVTIPAEIDFMSVSSYGAGAKKRVFFLFCNPVSLLIHFSRLLWAAGFKRSFCF